MAIVVVQEVYTLTEYNKDENCFIIEYQILGFFGEGTSRNVRKISRLCLEELNSPAKSVYAMKVQGQAHRFWIIFISRLV